MTSKHPQRCETCGHYDKFFGSCKLTWYQTSIQGHKETIHPETDGKGAWLVNRVGCASHSSASGPVPEPNPCEENGCTDIENCDEICEHMRIYTPAYVRESRQKARAEVLDEIFGYISTKGVEKRPEGYYVVFGTFSLADMLEYLESLRQQEGKP